MANKKSIGLPGGPNEYITDISEYLSVEGYKFNSPDVDNPFNIIESGSITMEDVEFPVLGTDNLGNTQMMQPGMNYQFPGDQVFEVPMMQEGGGVNEEGVEQYKWFKNYLQSPKYVERLKKEFPDYTDKQIGQEVKSRLENVMQTRVGFLPRSSDISPRVGATQGVYDADEYPGAIMLRPEYSASTSDWIFEPGNYLSGFGTTPLHEWSHAADEGGNRIPQSTNDFMLSRMKENRLDIPKDKYYYTIPTEYLGRMQPLRYLMEQEGLYDAGMEDFTIEDLKKARENKRIKNNVHFENLMDNVKSDEEFIELMNNVAAIDFEKQDDTMMAKKGGSVSWKWKGKSYSGKLIPSMETSKARYARTKNGKVKTLPKAQFGLFNKMGVFNNIKKNLADGFNANEGYIGSNRDGTADIDASKLGILRRLYNVGIKGEVEPDVSKEIDWDSKEGNSDDTYIDGKLAEASKNLEQNLFRLYLDQDQVGKYQMSESQYRPSKGDNKVDKYLSIPKEYQDNVYGENKFPTIIDIQEYEGLPNKDIVDALSSKYNKVIDRDMVVGDYTRGIGLNENDNVYLSAYDKFDLNPFPSQVGDMSMGIGKPQDIYDRFNYVRVNADKYPEFTFLKDPGGSSSYSDALVREDNLEDYLELQRGEQKRYEKFLEEESTPGDFFKQKGGQLPEAQFGLLKNALKPTLKYLKKYFTKADEALPVPKPGANSKVNFIDNVYKQQLKDAPRIPGYEMYNAENPPRLKDLVNHYNKQSSDVTSVYRYGFDKDMPGGSWYSSDLGDPLRYQKYGRGDGVFKADVPNNILKESYRGFVNNADQKFADEVSNSLTNFKEFRLSEGIASVFADQKFGKKTIQEYMDYIRSLKQQGGSILKEYDPPGFLETVGDIFANPVTSLGYSARNEPIPDRLNVNNPNRNTFDMVADVFNPFAWYQYAENADNNFSKGEYFDATFDALGAIPFIPAWLSKGKKLKEPIQKTTQNLLSSGVKDVQKVKSFDFKTLPGVQAKEFIKMIDGEFSAVDYKHLVPTKGEIGDIAKRTRERLLTDKFINNNIKATGRSKEEILGYIDNYINEFQNSVIQFDKLPAGTSGLYTKGKITIDPLNKFLTKDNVLGTIQHEIEHMFSSASRVGSDLYRHPTLKLVDTGVTGPNTKLIKNVSQPFEQQVRFRKALDWLQTNAGLKPGGKVTDLQVEKLTDALTNWGKGSPEFKGTGKYADVQHLFGSLDARQFLSKGQYLMPGANPYANLKNPNVRSAIKDILNKTFSVAAPVAVGSTALSQEQDGNGEAVMNNLDKVSAQRRDDLNKAIETVVTSQGGSNDLSSLLLMTSAMENSHGADSTAYENPETGKPRTYTRGMMSIDDIAYDDLYKPRGEKGKYSAKQLQNYKWLESLGLDYKNIDQKLRSNDPLANIATARLQYSRVADPLPKSSDLDGMYNYYMKYYNKTDADHKDRFTQFYNELIAKEKEGGEPDMLSTYKNYINGNVKSQEAVNVYDKLNRIHLNDARRMGMTVPNYIMTHL